MSGTVTKNVVKENNKKQNEAKFVDNVLKYIIKSSHSVEININFLGSGHPASKHVGSGKQYGKYKEVYINYNLYGDLGKINLTFSGPTTLDIKKPTVASITEVARKILKDLIDNICRLPVNKITINILGHSRGGIIAQKIYNWLSKQKFDKSVVLNNLSLADPYAGPINRKFHKKMDNLDKNKTNNIPNHKLVVYTVAEKRFRDPAKSLQSGRICFTDVSHDKTKYIAKYILENTSHYTNSLYICADPNNELTNIVHNEPEKLGRWAHDNIKAINKNNIIIILNGLGIYKNFAYNKISSSKRRWLLYKTLAKAYPAEVKGFLEKNNYRTMLKNIIKEK